MTDDVSTIPGVTRRVTRSQTRDNKRLNARETERVGEGVDFLQADSRCGVWRSAGSVGWAWRTWAV